MVDRMMRAVRADIELYEEVENNPSYTQEAYTIVGIVAALSAVGGLVTALLLDTNPIVGAIQGGLGTLLGYFLWSFLAYFIGTNVFKGTADVGELQRTLGYAWTPQILAGILGAIPVLGCLAVIPSIWSLYLGFVAIRQALDFDNQKAALTALLALIPYFVILVLLGSLAAAFA